MEPIVNDQGNGGAAPAAPSVDTTTPAPNGQDGSQGAPAAQQPAGDQETVASLRAQLRAMQEQLVGGRQMGGQQSGNDQGIDLSTPEGQYMVALEIGTSRLRGELENIFPLYPEIPAEDIALVRSNPWAFVKPDVQARADWNTAKWQVEEALAKRAEKLAKAQPAAPAVNPATISNNPAPAGNDPQSQAEEVDPWSMPMDELEKIAMKEKAKLSSPK